jgi:hypothetical protein
VTMQKTVGSLTAFYECLHGGTQLRKLEGGKGKAIPPINMWRFQRRRLAADWARAIQVFLKGVHFERLHSRGVDLLV